ncbi:hypothetical protein B0T10DRAFT_601106 [Thelonectria olida]|uniref:BTB domain-containing protein n=1 Tax=Thelonectria olida TaxID=1576542 RepID=A0A9P8WEL0_9HYPO|nr:hypothetical protein B0T10DRAFT_601106 [Thelonectria olida]
MKLKCEEKKFSLHKAIVCAHSTVFAAAFWESTTNAYEIKNFNIPAVEAMIEFMYTVDYTLFTGAINEANDSEPPGSEHSDMEEEECTLEIPADEQLLRHVQKRSNEYIRPILVDNWCPETFPVVVQEALNTTEDVELRKDLSNFAIEHLVELDGIPEFFNLENSTEFYAALSKQSFQSYVDLMTKNAALELGLSQQKSTIAENELTMNNMNDCFEKLKAGQLPQLLSEVRMQNY